MVRNFLGNYNTPFSNSGFQKVTLRQTLSVFWILSLLAIGYTLHAAIVETGTAIKAIDYSQQSGVKGDDVSEAVYDINHGDWVKYSSVDFWSGISNRLRVNVSVPTNGNQSIYIRIDGVQWKRIGTLRLKPTSTSGNFGLQEAYIQSVSGVHDLYLVGYGTGGLAKIQTLQLFRRTSTTSTSTSSIPVATIPPATLVSISGGNVSEHQGAQIWDGVASYLDNGDWLAYKNISFVSDAKEVGILLWVPAEYAGQIIEIRLGSPTGTKVGEMKTVSTGGWGTYSEQKGAVVIPKGTHNIYLVMKGTYGIANIKSITFRSVATTSSYNNTTSTATTPPTTTTTPTPTPTTTNINGGITTNTPYTPSTSNTPSSSLSSIWVPSNEILTNSAPLILNNVSGKTYTNLRISNPNGPCITINNSSNIKITKSKIGPCKTGIKVQGGSSIEITQNTITDVTEWNTSNNEATFDGNGVETSDTSNVSIRYNHIENATSGFVANGGTNVIFDHNYVKNVHGTQDRSLISRIGWQMTQYIGVGAGSKITCNVSDQIPGIAWTEDHVNMWESKGTADNPILIAYNKIKGFGPSDSNGGIILGDGAGSYIRVIKNNIINAGGYGVAIAGGHDNYAANNKIYGNCSNCTVGLYINDYSSAQWACYNNLMENNRVYYRGGQGGGFDWGSWYGDGGCQNSSQRNNIMPDTSLTADALWNEEFPECK